MASFKFSSTRMLLQWICSELFFLQCFCCICMGDTASKGCICSCKQTSCLKVCNVSKIEWLPSVQQVNWSIEISVVCSLLNTLVAVAWRNQKVNDAERFWEQEHLSHYLCNWANSVLGWLKEVTFEPSGLFWYWCNGCLKCEAWCVCHGLSVPFFRDMAGHHFSRHRVNPSPLLALPAHPNSCRGLS